MEISQITSLRNEFIQEANSAPKLFKDLAKVEQYIGESYKTRSFIELIQNADDAQATNFGVHGFSNGFIVANNGRPFTIEDLEAICRSGSSNKYRGGSTIGYRGIGFKSVVNLAKRIYVLSGEFSFYFDKAATKKLFPKVQDVPLIRIPHLYEPDSDIDISNEVEALKDRHKYTTLFVFLSINKRIAEEEISDFDKSSLLFLNNIRQVCFDLKNVNRTISVVKSASNNQEIVKVKEAAVTDEWEVLHSPKDTKDIVALKRLDGTIVPASHEESVVHSFTPTIEFSGAYFKINGDYSTDPSRKNVDMDEVSQKSFDNAVSLIVDTIIKILEGKIVKKGFFSPFGSITGREGSKFRGLLLKGIATKLNANKLNINGKEVNFSSLRLRPDWLNYEDYEKLCAGEMTFLSKELAILYPELPSVLEQVGIKKLYLEETLEKVNSTKISTTGAGQIGVKVINQYRYDLSKEKVDRIKNLKILPVNDKVVTANEVKMIDEVNTDFVDYVFNNADKHDLKPFFSKLGIDIESKINESSQSDTIEKPKSHIEEPISGLKPKSIFKATPNIQKWRSSEKNAHEYLNSLDGVLSVADVSNANMGYDLEVLLQNGKKIFVEIKSVSSFSEPIKITNNEYSSAHNYGGSYCLAIVINEEPFQIKLVPDPIRSLSFEKQIERWSWFCESYREKLIEIESLFTSLSFGGDR